MTSAQKVNVAARNKVVELERRFGRKRLYIFGGIAIAAVLLLVLRACNGRAAKPPPPGPRPVAVTKVIQKDVPRYIDEIGTCAAYETVQVQAQVSGQILTRNFQDGAEVKKGDLLFTIDPRPFQAALGQAQGQLAQAQSQLVLDQITLKRQQELRARNVVSPQDLDTAQGTVNGDEAKVKTAQAAVAAAQVNLDYASIRSPIDGRVGLRNVDVGNVVTGGTSGPILVTIQRLDPIYTDFTIAETDLPTVRPYLNRSKLTVLTKAPDDSTPPISGELYFIDNAIQPGAGTVKARAVSPNPDRQFWAAEFVRVRVVLETLKGATLVPSQAVQISQNGPYVFVVKPDNTLDLRQVKAGQRQDNDMVVIEEGLKPNESVVVSGQLALAPGIKVAPQQAQAAPAKG